MLNCLLYIERICISKLTLKKKIAACTGMFGPVKSAFPPSSVSSLSFTYVTRKKKYIYSQPHFMDAGVFNAKFLACRGYYYHYVI